MERRPEGPEIFSYRSNLEQKEKRQLAPNIVVTGGSRDIGEAVIEELTAEAAAKNQVLNIISSHNLLLSKSKDRAARVSGKVKASGSDITFVPADIFSPEGIESMVSAVRNLGELNTLILNTSPREMGDADALSELARRCLEIMPANSDIILMQSYGGKYPGIADISKEYAPIAKVKHLGENLLYKLEPELEKKGSRLTTLVIPEVKGTINARFFTGKDPESSRIHEILAAKLGIPASTSKQEVGKKVVDILTHPGRPVISSEFFNDAIDPCPVLSGIFDDNARYVDIFYKESEDRGTGKLIVTREHTQGHFTEKTGISIMPGHKLMEAANQTLGLVVLFKTGIKNTDLVPALRGSDQLKFISTAIPDDILSLRAEVTASKGSFYKGNVEISTAREDKEGNMQSRIIAKIGGITFILVPREELLKQLPQNRKS